MKSPFKEIADIDRRIEELQAERVKLACKALATLSPIRQFASALHAEFCTYNHTDGCSWAYEKDDDEDAWTKGYCRPTWVAKAQKTISMIEQIYNVDLRHFKGSVR